jgi:hypothetical protein
MARSIVLRFDATCFDCGSLLSAGTTARWLGKGRVSCCPPDADNARRAATAATRPYLPPFDAPRNDRPELNPRSSAAPGARMQPNVPLSRVESLSVDTGVPVENLASGLSPEHVAILAAKTPNQRLLVRLQTGARLIVPALHAEHVLRCITESCIDRVRDVALLADGKD